MRSTLITTFFILNALTQTKSLPPMVENCGMTEVDFSTHNGEIPTIPFQSIITFVHRNGTKMLVPGILISESLVLAHGANFLHNRQRVEFHPWSVYGAILSPRNMTSSPDATNSIVNVTHIRLHPSHHADVWYREKNMIALVHLSHPTGESWQRNPVCLPQSADETLIHYLSRNITNATSELAFIGWHLGLPGNKFQKLKIQSIETCNEFWLQWVGRDCPFDGRWCAVVSKENEHSLCIEKSTGAIRKYNNSYYLAEIDNFYLSGTTSRETCWENTVNFFEYFGVGTLQWIERNIRCGPHMFTCTNGDCIPLSKTCDQTMDCSDNSDEEHAYCRGVNFCSDNEIECGTYGPCLQSGTALECPKDVEGRNIPLVIGVAAAILASMVCIPAYIYFRKMHYLAQEELDLFFGGDQLNPEDGVKSCGDPGRSNALKKPWDKKFEIDMDNFELGWEISRGAFGIVFEARSHATRERFAVKVSRSEIGAVEFKCLLSELKILAYIGDCPHIVKFVGACTKDVRNRKVYLFEEFCSRGDLQTYLRNCEAAEKSFEFPRHEAYLSLQKSYVSLGCPNFLEHQRRKWTVQLACGMDFLVSKRIIHMDLAARNVLLSEELDIKICDFGLSRPMFEFSDVYIKCTNDPLPFRWMAPESFKQRTFSEKSDVWSFGVTIWEIYSDAQIPYGDNLDDIFLAEKIEEGLRLYKPAKMDDNLYNVILTTWILEPEKRPSFLSLKAMLQSSVIGQVESEFYADCCIKGKD